MPQFLELLVYAAEFCKMAAPDNLRLWSRLRIPTQ